MMTLLLLFGLACSSQSAQTPAAPEPASTIPPVAGEPRNLNGIRVIDIAAGTGDVAARGRCLYSHYTGWLATGQKVESSLDAQPNGRPGEPVAFPLGRGMVMAGWEVGFAGMRVGGRRRLFVPYSMAYGDKGNPPLIPSRAAMVFDVELVAVMGAEGNMGSTCPPLRR